MSPTISGFAAGIADTIAVMYAGRIVESGPVAQILSAPEHPYTAGLLASTVHGQPRDRDIDAIPGSPPDLRRLAQGCSFAPRCPRRIADCRVIVPQPRFPAPGRMAACHAVADGLPATEVEHVGAEHDHFGSLAGTYVAERCELPLA